MSVEPLLLLCWMLAARMTASPAPLHEVFSWRSLTFKFPDDNEASLRLYDEANNLPLGLEVAGRRLFVTVPRWKTGVAATLNYISLDDVSLDGPPTSPALTPYPSWEANRLPDDAAVNRTDYLISTFRVRADECDRLWVMDTGVADVWGTPRRYTAPKLNVYSLSDDKLLRVYILPEEHVTKQSFFANIAVDIDSDACDDAFAYLPDLGGNALIVYSWKDNASWRITHHFFHFDPLAGNYSVAGINFQWSDGVFGVALSPRRRDGDRALYFHPMSSLYQFAVSTSVLKNRTSTDTEVGYDDFHVLGWRGPSTQSTACFVDENTGVMFYTLINRNAVACWNTASPVTPETQGVVAQDDNALIFVNDLKVSPEGRLWVLSDRLPQFLYHKLDFEDVNFRILTASVSDAVAGTVCGSQ